MVHDRISIGDELMEDCWDRYRYAVARPIPNVAASSQTGSTSVERHARHRFAVWAPDVGIAPPGVARLAFPPPRTPCREPGLQFCWRSADAPALNGNARGRSQSANESRKPGGFAL